MKNILLLLLGLIGLSASSQIVIDSSATYKADAYAGILTGPIFTKNESKIKANAFITVRLGGSVTWQPKPWFTLFGVAAVQVNEVPKVDYVYLIGTRFNLHPKVWITAGKVASPMTELRPLPHTGGGQFEPWTKRQILGSAFGAKLTYQINEKYSLVAGGFWRGDTIATAELGVRLPYTQLAGYYRIDNKTFGAAILVTTKYVSQTLQYSYKGTFGMLTNVTIPKTAGFALYSDVGFDATSWKCIRGEWGVLKLFSIKKVKGLFGAGYCYEGRSVNGYLQINL